MRRKLLKVLALTAVFSFSSAFNVSLAFAAENTESGALQALSENDTEINSMFTMENKQKEAQKAYAELMETMDSPQLYSREPNMSYKEYYGGAYVGDDNVLVVNVTTPSDNVKKEIQEITESQNVKFKEVMYSYEQLMDLYEIISDKMKNSDLKEKINCFYVDETNNRVVVEVLDDKAINDFNQEILCNEAVTFNVVKEAISTDATIQPGDRLTIGNGGYSAGWRAWRINGSGNYVEGFITSAHGNSVSDEVRTASGTVFGTIGVRAMSDTVDAAFAKCTNNTIELSNVIKYSGNSLKDRSYIISIPEGYTVYKVGNTTGLTSGKVISNNCSMSVYGITISDFVKTDYTSEGGDSGGLVYTNVDGYYSILGNHEGHDASYSYVVKASNIMNRLSVNPY